MGIVPLISPLPQVHRRYRPDGFGLGPALRRGGRRASLANNFTGLIGGTIAMTASSSASFQKQGSRRWATSGVSGGSTSFVADVVQILGGRGQSSLAGGICRLLDHVVVAWLARRSGRHRRRRPARPGPARAASRRDNAACSRPSVGTRRGRNCAIILFSTTPARSSCSSVATPARRCLFKLSASARRSTPVRRDFSSWLSYRDQPAGVGLSGMASVPRGHGRRRGRADRRAHRGGDPRIRPRSPPRSPTACSRPPPATDLGWFAPPLVAASPTTTCRRVGRRGQSAEAGESAGAHAHRHPAGSAQALPPPAGGVRASVRVRMAALAQRSL